MVWPQARMDEEILVRKICKVKNIVKREKGNQKNVEQESKEVIEVEGREARNRKKQNP